MEIQLKELIETIKEEGLKIGEAQAVALVEKAKKEAESILNVARNEANTIVTEATNQANKEMLSSEAAIKQASRDLILNLHKEIENIFSKLILSTTKEALTGDLLKEAILAVVKGIIEEKSDLVVLVDSKKLPEIEKALLSSLSNEVKKGLEIKPFDQLEAGFRVAMKDGSAFYDFSDTEIAQILSVYLNQKLATILLNE